MKFLYFIGTALAVKVQKWGEVSAELAPEAIYEKMASDDSVRDYIMDGPGS